MIKISIIVSIYNVENYLIRCLDSLINQKYKNLEIILVDDGSTDNSNSICLEYKNKDKRIKLIREENKGLSGARNTGLKHSNGEFIWFVDGDDYIDDKSIDIILKYLDSDTDIVIFNFYKDIKKKIKIKGYSSFNNDTKYILSWPCVWNKIFRKTILYNNMFPESHIYEDLYVIPTLILKTNKIKYIDNYLYYYVYRTDSISNSGNNNIERKYALNNIEKLLSNKYYNEVEYLYIYHLLVINIRLFQKKLNNSSLKNIVEINKYIKKKFPKYYKNIYLKKDKKIILFIIYYLL